MVSGLPADSGLYDVYCDWLLKKKAAIHDKDVTFSKDGKESFLSLRWLCECLIYTLANRHRESGLGESRGITFLPIFTV